MKLVKNFNIRETKLKKNRVKEIWKLKVGRHLDDEITQFKRLKDN